MVCNSVLTNTAGLRITSIYGSKFIVKTSKENSFAGCAIIIASGAVEKKLEIKDEKKFINLGFFVNQEVAVVGGGYSALEMALYISTVAKKVYLIHHYSEFQA
ncbi:18565_t:CDS:2 [Racocetra fulgida]|uniref:18565_t:CDS:1 n=1 Tax=Racocetra fulgida TaxID=60492 RepID=A0A9N8VT63_9GLOM|nr:18565_t:CDS:2 [Racocetra fulgida]